MYGFLKVLYGKGRVQTFSRTDKVAKLAPNSPVKRLFKQHLSPWQEKTIFPVLAGPSNLQLDEKSPCCILTPQEDNLHFLQPLKNENLIFFDLLTPPYLPGRRDCHYFTVLEPILILIILAFFIIFSNPNF
uniref:Uncharacterized protein n=1 Tax=Romanomermis culicivorax TaxID=13658 RepID=A0A915IPI8_ROMCU